MHSSESHDPVETGMKPGIVLVVKEPKRKGAYLTALGSASECTVLESLRDLPGHLRKNPCKGILIDVSLNIKATYMEKVRISDSLDAMPSATLNYDARRGSIRLLMLNQKFGAASDIDEFITLCAKHEPGIMYPRNKGSLHLNALLSPVPDFMGDTEHTFTLYVSGSGCFLFTVNRTLFLPGDVVWIDFVGLSDRSPIQGRVSWKSEWGMAHTVPGIYVSFESMLECQYDEISSLMGSQ